MSRRHREPSLRPLYIIRFFAKNTAASQKKGNIYLLVIEFIERSHFLGVFGCETMRRVTRSVARSADASNAKVPINLFESPLNAVVERLNEWGFRSRHL